MGRVGKLRTTLPKLKKLESDIYDELKVGKEHQYRMSKLLKKFSPFLERLEKLTEKRSEHGYNLFVSTKYNKWSQNNPGKSRSAFIKWAGKKWSKLPDADKDSWRQKAEDKEED